MKFIPLGIGAAVALAAVWFAGLLTADKGSDRLVLRIGLAAIVLIAAAAIAWFLAQKKKPTVELPISAGQPSGEIEGILREAEERLAAGQLAQGAKFGNLPILLVLGPASTAKTTVVVHSGLEPELLAGQVYQDNAIASTALANFWFAKRSVFVEAGAKLLSDSASWSRLVSSLRPGKLKSVMSQGAESPRAVVVCFDVENLLRLPLEANLTEARLLRTRLGEFGQLLGIRIPVYALFTKMDRLSFFQEFVANLNDEEALQVFGATMPLQTASGLYGEDQTARLNQAYQQLFYSVAAKRPDFLARENVLQKTPDIYEFPREFRKLRAAIVPFLVELCRPSQLNIGPFLRGFYFTGVRPVIVQEIAAAPAARPAMRPDYQAEPEATRMFRPASATDPRADLVGSNLASRKVPQWVFLHSLFKDVFLQDSAASVTSGSSSKTNLLRRWLLGSAAVASLLLGVAFLVSFSGNRDLETTALSAARGISAAEATGAALPSIDALNRLETLRQSLDLLTHYDREGAPLALRWGLYSGGGLYPHVRKLYFDRFHQLLLAPVQQAWIANLKSLPPSPSANESYERGYDTLKGYLITTSHHEKSTQQFLSPLLFARWSEGRAPGSERLQLAQKQFDFYSQELKLQNPFSNETEGLAVERGRHYLSQFAGTERVYQFMLAEANKTNAPVNFNQKFPGSAEEVVNNRDVSGAYTKSGWAAMQNAIKNVDRYFNGEQWVLGEGGAAPSLDRASLEQQLKTRYANDFIGQWRDYLRRSSVVKYIDIKDAVKKLSATSNAQSPLLAMFWLASQNTAVDAPDVLKAMKPLHAVMPTANIDQYVGPTNADYMKALASLQVSLEQVAGEVGSAGDTAASQTLSLANSSRLLTRQMALSFGLDPEGHLNATVQKLLEDPITNVEGLLRGLGPADLNTKAKGLCTTMRALSVKYPFNPATTAQATLPEVNAIFQPKEGALWKFYQENLIKLLAKQGAQYALVPGGAVQLTPGFVNFFNRAAAFSDALYSGGSAEPHLTFSLKPVKAEGIESMSLEIDGQTLTYSASAAAAAKQFTWPGTMHQVKASVPFGIWADHHGLWGLFKFFDRVDKWQPSGSGSSLEWFIRIGKDPMMLPTGGPLTVRFDLDMGANPPVFQKGYLSSIGCVAEVAK